MFKGAGRIAAVLSLCLFAATQSANVAHAQYPTRAINLIVPAAAGGQRLAVAAYGPRTDVFVDRVLCRVLTP